MRSRLPWAAYSRLPRRAATVSPGGNHGASATTPWTLGSSATWTAVRPPIECPRRQTGTSPSSSRTASSALRASAMRSAPPFQPRWVKRSSHVLTSASWAARAMSRCMAAVRRQDRLRPSTTSCPRALPPWSITMTARGRTRRRTGSGAVQCVSRSWTVFGAVDPSDRMSVRAGKMSLVSDDVDGHPQRRGRSTRRSSSRSRTRAGATSCSTTRPCPTPTTTSGCGGCRRSRTSGPSCARPTPRPRRSAARCPRSSRRSTT